MKKTARGMYRIAYLAALAAGPPQAGFTCAIGSNLASTTAQQRPGGAHGVMLSTPTGAGAD